MSGSPHEIVQFEPTIMIFYPDDAHHLRSMAMHGVDLNEVELQVTTQLAWTGQVRLSLSDQDGHEFAHAPKSMRFTRVRPDGIRQLLLVLEIRQPAGAPLDDQFKSINWVFAGPAGVFSPRQVKALWAAMHDGYQAVVDQQFPYSPRFLERESPEISGTSSHLLINLGRLMTYQRLSREIFDRLLEDLPADDLMFQRTRVQALYEKYPCDQAEFAAVCALRPSDPLSRAYYGIDAYYEYYAQSRGLLDPEKGLLEFKDGVREDIANLVRHGASRGLTQAYLTERIVRAKNVHMNHVPVLEALVADVFAETQRPYERQAA